MKKVVLILGIGVVAISIAMAIKKSFEKGSSAVPRIIDKPSKDNLPA